MRYQVKSNNFEAQARQAKRQYKADMRRASLMGTDRISKKGQRAVQARMRGVGLGRLARGVGQSSALKKADKTRIYGVVYARGQSEVDSRTAGAIEAYSQGTIIRGKWGNWLAIATNLLPRITNRRRMTPMRYQTTGWEQRLGPLEFRPISRTEALLVVKRVTVHPKTGRGKRAGPGKSRTRIAKDEAVAFVLIKWTARAQRFDEKSLLAAVFRGTPDEIGAALDEIRDKRGAR